MISIEIIELVAEHARCRLGDNIKDNTTVVLTVPMSSIIICPSPMSIPSEMQYDICNDLRNHLCRRLTQRYPGWKFKILMERVFYDTLCVEFEITARKIS